MALPGPSCRTLCAQLPCCGVFFILSVTGEAVSPSQGAFLWLGALANYPVLHVTIVLSESPLFKPMLSKCHHCEFAWKPRDEKKPSQCCGKEGGPDSHLKG